MVEVAAGSMSLSACPGCVCECAIAGRGGGRAGLTKTVGLETALAEQVTCNAICPGYVLTDLVRNQLEDTSRARGIPVVRML